MIDLTPTRQDLTFMRGDTLVLSFAETLPNSTTPRDLAGCTYEMKIVIHATEVLVLTIVGTVSSPTTLGQFAFTVTAVQTLALNPSVIYRYQVRETFGSVITTKVYGTARVVDNAGA